MSKSYTTGLIAFLDILGFSNYIEKTKSASEVEEVFEFVEKICYLYNSSEINGIKIAFFSDSFILTTEEITSSSITSLVTACHLINISLFKATQLFTRGAMCVGEFYHKDNIAFGPGIIEAYREQENNAKYIRLILGNSLIEVLNDKKIYNPFIDKDINGTYYCNYYLLDITDAYRTETFNFEEAVQIMEKNRNIIIENLEKYQNTKVYEKYEWLIYPFNKCCEVLSHDPNISMNFMNFQIK
ncbi:hypothetical protein [Paenibacillus agilis]|uniref:Guanylate cyclase domain-containing protein n=1 Tax=Paenibacillus agilis TaxID=3020863 RepID=A0A559J2M9_9BACL|nr:hypothetical protein [Paenibacillus agilis]TVX94123.1 hypothetical protein FPZ44_14320 [Paenibacillus agilis]